jgi:Uma2 family endonuclease
VPDPAHRVRYTYAEYLALEASSNVKHEYLDGQIYGMAGGTPQHAALAAAIVGLLFGQLRSGCRAHSADLRLRVQATGLATYPDVTIVCGRSERDPEDEQAVTNPTAIVEVLSPSTEGYDRGDKFEHYKTIASLRQYVLVAHDRRRVEVWTRSGEDGWTHEVSEDGETATLSSIGCTVGVRALYDAVTEPDA